MLLLFVTFYTHKYVHTSIYVYIHLFMCVCSFVFFSDYHQQKTTSLDFETLSPLPLYKLG